MKKREFIFTFPKTEHFLYQQWERGIDDKVVQRVLSYSSPVKVGKTNIIATPKFLLEKANLKKKKSLVIVIQNDVLVTAYWCKDPEYLKRTEPKTCLQIL